MPVDRPSPYVPRDITAINPEQDKTVRILGTVLQVKEDSAVIDDGTGSLEVFLSEEDVNTVEEKDTVRVFGRVLPTPNGFELQGEILQDATDVDPDTYKKVVQLLQG